MQPKKLRAGQMSRSVQQHQGNELFVAVHSNQVRRAVAVVVRSTAVDSPVQERQDHNLVVRIFPHVDVHRGVTIA